VALTAKEAKAKALKKALLFAQTYGASSSALKHLLDLGATLPLVGPDGIPITLIPDVPNIPPLVVEGEVDAVKVGEVHGSFVSPFMPAGVLKVGGGFHASYSLLIGAPVGAPKKKSPAEKKAAALDRKTIQDHFAEAMFSVLPHIGVQDTPEHRRRVCRALIHLGMGFMLDGGKDDAKTVRKALDEAYSNEMDERGLTPHKSTADDD
jgi:hypothetical protein